MIQNLISVRYINCRFLIFSLFILFPSFYCFLEAQIAGKGIGGRPNSDQSSRIHATHFARTATDSALQFLRTQGTNFPFPFTPLLFSDFLIFETEKYGVFCRDFLRSPWMWTIGRVLIFLCPPCYLIWIQSRF